jgi:hypothetical protein
MELAYLGRNVMGQGLTLDGEGNFACRKKGYKRAGSSDPLEFRADEGVTVDVQLGGSW